MAQRYGLPYQGSKNAIAEWVVGHLPRAETLVDLFCGGCAVTHAALLSGKWERIIANDIHADVPQLFVDAVKGRYTPESRSEWISREDFFKQKDMDAYVRLCWSFGNDGRSYIYSRELEPFKMRLHELIFGPTISKRMTAWRAFVSEFARMPDLNIPWAGLNESLEGLQSLERLQSLEGLQRLELVCADYRDVLIPNNAVVYCDIPYRCTRQCYGSTFDYAAFYDWACAQAAPVIVSGYSIDDDRFAVLAETQKKQLKQGAKHQKTVTERLYCPKHQREMIYAMLEREKDEQQKLAM